MEIRKPNRITRSYTQHLVSSPSHIFPLLCPVLEADWIEEWEPLLVLSDSGVAEQDCVFLTQATPSNAIWFITRHEPMNCYVEMIKITPEVTACKLSIQLSPSEDGCEAIVTYSHTSLGPNGDTFLKEFTEEYYVQSMQEWENQLNHYLTSGTALPGKG